MVFHMKTTLVIDDFIMKRLKKEAAHRGTTISALVEAALRAFLDGARDEVEDLAALPSFKGGRALVDLSNRAALYDLMELE
jgi:non-ribosomal peptide synthetase component F